MPTTDRVVSIYPYFKVSEGKLDEFKALCDRFMAATATESKCLYYGFSFNEDIVHCREAYEDADGLLAHLDNVGPILNEALKISQIAQLELHGIPDELTKLKEPMAAFAPTYFTLEYGIRRLA